MLRIVPCLDSEEMAAARRRDLDVPMGAASMLGKTALEAAERGYYLHGPDKKVDWSGSIQAAIRAKVSIPPEAVLPKPAPGQFRETRVQVTNETTLLASRRLVEGGASPLALNFANGVRPGGGFLVGANAQEEVLCRSSALYLAIAGDEMYEHHRRHSQQSFSDWAIYTPDVPVFRRDDGTTHERPWPLTILTCAAPYAPALGQPQAGNLLRKRIHRVLAIAQAYGHPALVLGAWGCGAFGNDIRRTANDFLLALRNDYCGAFSDVVFAIADASPVRKTLGPFRDIFSQ